MTPDFWSFVDELTTASDWKFIASARRAAGTLPPLPSKETRKVLERFADEMRRGKTDRALALFRAGVLTSPSIFVREVRRAGAFRASKFAFQSDRLSRVVARVVVDRAELGLSATELAYFRSVENLLTLSPTARLLRSWLVQRIRRHHKTVIKSCLVFVDRAFRSPVGTPVDEQAQRADLLGDPRHFSREEKAAGLSLLIVLFQETLGFGPGQFGHVDESIIRNGDCEEMLLAAARLNALQEAETTLDAYPYTVDKIDDGVTLFADEPQLEQSIRFGFITMRMQLIGRNNYLHSPALASVPSLRDFALQAHARLGYEWVRLLEEPTHRYVMRLPIEGPFIERLRDDGFFREEMAYLEGIRSDSFADPAWMLTAVIAPGVVLRDLMRVHRAFVFISTFFFAHIDRHPIVEERDELDMRSRMPVFPANALLGFISKLVGLDTAERVLAMLSFDPALGGHFDLQYRPLVKVGGYYALPLSVFVLSDIVRNVLCEHGTRLLPRDEIDPMQVAAADSLRARGFRVAMNVLQKFDDRPLEIDILAYSEGRLFVMECKNAFHPCSAHEMRTSYGHIQKAASQLDRAREFLQRPGAQRQLFDKLGWPDAKPATEPLTCVVTANRIFSGYAFDGHPVRQIHELRNVLSDGQLAFSDRTYQFWKGSTFVVDDLVSYLRGESITRDVFDAMVDFQYAVPLADRVDLFIRSYALDFELLESIARNRYVLLPKTQPGNIAAEP